MKISEFAPVTVTPTTIPNPRCRDSAITSNVQAQTYASLQVHGITYSNVQRRDKVVFSLYSYYTAPNAQVITGIGFALNPTGLDVGARCNKLHINIALPWFPMYRRTSGTSAYSGLATFVTPWIPSMSGAQVVLQSAWTDSKTNAFSLTRAVRVSFPKDKPKPHRRVGLYHYIKTSKTGIGPYIGAAWLNPIMRISHR